jgi:hypothetical protein
VTSAAGARPTVTTQQSNFRLTVAEAAGVKFSKQTERMRQRFTSFLMFMELEFNKVLSLAQYLNLKEKLAVIRISSNERAICLKWKPVRQILYL